MVPRVARVSILYGNEATDGKGHGRGQRFDQASGGRSRGLWVWTASRVVAFEVAIETGAADAEDFRGAEAVAVAHFQDFLDVLHADFVERKRMPVLTAGVSRVGMLEMLGEVAEIDEIASGGDARGG